MLMMLWAGRMLTGVLGSLVFLGANLTIRSLVPATSHINVLKYANIISMLRTNELIGGYRNLFWFGTPIPLLSVIGRRYSCDTVYCHFVFRVLFGFLTWQA